MASNKTFLALMKDATGFCESYRGANIDPAHRRADNAYHGILENEDEYIKRGRSMLFIPKTRDHVRRWTTTIVNAFYLSDDIATVSYPADPAAERFTNEVFNLRLERDTTFFLFLSHAAHAHVKYGNAIGKTGWDYRENTRIERVTDDETLEEYEVEVDDPLVDRPFFELVPFENVQFDYRLIGTDPAQDSPFFRQWIPMYRSDVEEKMRSGVWKRQKNVNWEGVAIPTTADSVRSARQGRMQDPETNDVANNEEMSASYRRVWVVENYFRVGGTDWTFLSLGDEVILTSPERVVDKFPSGKRPFAISQFDPEAFRVYSDGLPEMMKGLQAEINSIRNQRRDNVSLVLNRGHYVKKGAKIQLSSLQTPRPGMIVLGDNISTDSIRPMDAQDVTSSAYNEEQISERNIEEISGQSQNALGVSGSDRQSATEAAIKASSAGEIEAYVIKCFLETLVRPLLEQNLDNIVAYENDPEILAMAAVNTGVEPDPELLRRGELVINAGMGSTNKELKSAGYERVMDKLIQLAPLDREFLNAAKDVMRRWLPLKGVKNVDIVMGSTNAPQGATVGGAAPSPGGGGLPSSPQAQPAPPNLPNDLGAAMQENPAMGGLARGMLS